MKFPREIENLIAQFCGLPRNESKAVHRKTKSMQELIGQCITDYKIGEPKTKDIIMENWKHIIGINYAHRCCPQSIKKSGTLVIMVPNGIIRNELQFQNHLIIKRLNSIKGCEEIKKLTFIAN